jgi:hypothetical protein
LATGRRHVHPRGLGRQAGAAVGLDVDEAVGDAHARSGRSVECRGTAAGSQDLLRSAVGVEGDVVGLQGVGVAKQSVRSRGHGRGDHAAGYGKAEAADVAADRKAVDVGLR